MKYLILKSALIFILISIIFILIQSCCKETFRISPKVIRSGVWTMVGQGRHQTDTIRSNFIISTDFEVILCSYRQNFSLVNSTFATTCKKTFLNFLIPQSLTLTIDKPFIYNNDTVLTNENLIKLPKVIPQIDEGGSAEVRFPQEFIDNSKFQPGKYTFTLNGMTNDSIKLTNSIDIYIDI